MNGKRTNDVLALTAALFVFHFTSCGGGAGGSSGGGGGGTTQKIPTLTAIAPSSAAAGAPSVTLAVYGSNFESGATVQWNGNRLESTWKNAAQMIATIPVGNLASVGTAQVTVQNPGGGSSSARNFTISAKPAPTTWVRKVAGIETGDNTSPEPARNIVWDAAHGRLYYSIPSTAKVAPNTISVIDPVVGAVERSVATGNDPDLLSVSSDFAYLWVGLDGDHAVQRFRLPELTTDISFPIPTNAAGDPQQPVGLVAAPVSPNTVALMPGTWLIEPAGNGIYVFDDATVRPTSFSGNVPDGPMLEWFQWGADDSTIYGNQYSFSFLTGIATLDVSSSGVSFSRYKGGAAWYMQSTQYNRVNGLLYTTNLRAFDPLSGTIAGTFNSSPAPLNIPLGIVACTVDPLLGRYYCVEEGDLYDYELLVFDVNTYAMLDRVLFGTSAGEKISPITGLPHHLTRWGNAGLALTTKTYGGLGEGGFYLIDGAAINPNAPADVSSGDTTCPYAWLSSLNPQQVTAGSGDLNLTITGRNFTANSTACRNFSYEGCLPTFYVSSQQLTVTIPAALLASPGPFGISVLDTGSNLFSTNGLTLTVAAPATSGSRQVKGLNLTGFAIARDPNSARLYVGTADFDGAHPNSIVAVDGETASIVKAQTVGPNPDVISVSADGQYLYSGYAYATTVTRLQLPELGSPFTWSLSNPASSETFWVGDLKVAPENPHTVAATLLNRYTNPPYTGGLVIYDDATPRSDFLGGWASGLPGPGCLSTLAWSPSDELLSAACGAGALYGIQVSASGTSLPTTGPDGLFNTNSAELHSDFGTGLIYSDNGNVADPTTLETVGAYGASGFLVPDSSMNRVFILGQTEAQRDTNNYTVVSFDQQSYTLVSSITVENVYGSPFDFDRWGTSGLAILTLGQPASGFPGMLYLIKDDTFVSSAPQTAFQPAKSKELVQMRWKRITKSDIAKMLEARQSPLRPPQ